MSPPWSLHTHKRARMSLRACRLFEPVLQHGRHESQHCLKAQARQHVLEDLNKSGKAARVKGFERIAAVHLDTEEWSVDNDMVRPCPPLLLWHLPHSASFPSIPSIHLPFLVLLLPWPSPRACGRAYNTIRSFACTLLSSGLAQIWAPLIFVIGFFHKTEERWKAAPLPTDAAAVRLFYLMMPFTLVERGKSVLSESSPTASSSRDSALTRNPPDVSSLPHPSLPTLYRVDSHPSLHIS